MRARQKQVKGQQELSFACAAPKKAKAQAVALQEPRKCFSHATWLYHVFFPGAAMSIVCAGGAARVRRFNLVSVVYVGQLPVMETPQKRKRNQPEEDQSTQ